MNIEGQEHRFNIPEYSTWKCEIWGGTWIRPLKGTEPNRFWRLMQFLVLGFRWVNDKRN